MGLRFRMNANHVNHQQDSVRQSIRWKCRYHICKEFRGMEFTSLQITRKPPHKKASAESLLCDKSEFVDEIWPIDGVFHSGLRRGFANVGRYRTLHDWSAACPSKFHQRRWPWPYSHIGVSWKPETFKSLFCIVRTFRPQISIRRNAQYVNTYT